MTVAELVERLKEMPQYAIVQICTADEHTMYEECVDVRIDTENVNVCAESFERFFDQFKQ